MDIKRLSDNQIKCALTEEEIKLINLDENVDLEKELTFRHENVENIPQTEKEERIDVIMGRICVDKAIGRHAGKMEEMYTPMGMLYNQFGKDLSKINFVIGTGGVLVHNTTPQKILSAVEYTLKKGLELRPRNPRYMLDKDYILSAMGLLAEIDPLLALKIMKKHIIKI